MRPSLSLVALIMLIVPSTYAQPRAIFTYAGTGEQGFSGDGGPALKAQLDNPYGVVRGPDGAPITGTSLNGPRSLDFDGEGNLWLATREGNQVFKFDMNAGIIRHVAGTGEAGFTGNGGPAKAATLSGPKGIAIDAEGNVWLADTESHSVRMIDVRTGTLELIAGTGTKGDGPDGNPLQCAMNRLHGIFADADGSVFIGDSEAHRIRVLRRK